MLSIYGMKPKVKGKSSFENGSTFVVDTDRALLNADQNNRITKTNRKTTDNQIVCFYQYTKKDQE